MRILIAEDSFVSRRLLESALRRWGHEVIATSDGVEAWQALQGDQLPPLAILDWMMPGLDGLDLCRRIRQTPGLASMYVLLLTAKEAQQDIVTGLEAGADEYLAKPFDPAELQARIGVGRRIVELQQNLTHRIHDLEEAMAQVRQLQGLLPICAYCKKIRDEDSYWQEVERYITRRTEVQFSHGICPACYDRHIVPQIEAAISRA